MTLLRSLSVLTLSISVELETQTFFNVFFLLSVLNDIDKLILESLNNSNASPKTLQIHWISYSTAVTVAKLVVIFALLSPDNFVNFSFCNFACSRRTLCSLSSSFCFSSFNFFFLVEL